MHIKTRCPRCENTYQVDPGLKGKRMRCPNTLCRAVFEVQDVAQAPAPPRLGRKPLFFRHLPADNKKLRP